MINFPKVNIATSVVNRILNINDELKAGAAPSAGGMSIPNTPPSVPSPEDTGPQIDAALYAPTETSDAEDPAVAEAVALKGLL